MDKVVLNRSEFVRVIAERSDVPSDISRLMRYVETVLVLQSDEGRPVYVLEVDFDESDEAYLLILDRSLKRMKVSAVIVPKNSVGYVGEVTAKSLGIKGKVDAAREKLKALIATVMQYGGDEDER